MEDRKKIVGRIVDFILPDIARDFYTRGADFDGRQPDPCKVRRLFEEEYESRRDTLELFIDDELYDLIPDATSQNVKLVEGDSDEAIDEFNMKVDFQTAFCNTVSLLKALNPQLWDAVKVLLEHDNIIGEVK